MTGVLNLKKRTIYKWFWDTHKNEKAKAVLVKKMKNTAGSDNKDSETEKCQVEGKDGQGEELDHQQISTALQIYGKSATWADDFESIANSMGLSIERAAQKIILRPSPDGTRQVIKLSDRPAVFSPAQLPELNE